MNNINNIAYNQAKLILSSKNKYFKNSQIKQDGI
jgi:hypothetical protein